MAKILVIEDNAENLQLMIYLLKAFGHHPIETIDGQAGLIAAQNELPDLILCDIQLPGMDGFEFARRLRANPSLGHIPLVAVTALAMMGDRDRVLRTGFDGYISKPIVPELFASQVEAFILRR